jgi:hypothetical protein
MLIAGLGHKAAALHLSGHIENKGSTGGDLPGVKRAWALVARAFTGNVMLKATSDMAK